MKNNILKRAQQCLMALVMAFAMSFGVSGLSPTKLDAVITFDHLPQH